MTDYYKLAEASIKYLAESEAEYARLKGLVKYAPDRIKMYLAQLMLDKDNPESSQAGKKAWAEAHLEYEQTVNSFETISQELFEIQEKRHRAEISIEMFRSTNAMQKRGNV